MIDRSSPSPARRPATAVIAFGGAAAVFLVVYSAWLFARWGGELATVDAAEAGILLAAGSGFVLSARRAAITRDRGLRAAWALLAGTSGSWMFGEGVYSYYSVVLGTSTPFPSLGDVGYLTGGLLGIPAVLLLCGPRWGSSRVRYLLDGSIAGVALLLLSWLTVMRAVFAVEGFTPLQQALSLAYPVVDVITVGIVISSLSRTGRRDAATLIVGGGLVCTAISDSAFAYLGAKGLFQVTTIVDTGWAAAYLSFGLAALTRPAPERAAADDQLTRWQIILPYVPLGLAGVAAAFEVARGGSLDAVAALALAALVVLVLGRQLMAVVESQSLSNRLTSTVTALTRTSAERELLIEQAPAGICRLDREGRLVAGNQTLQRMLGREREELLGQRFLGFVHPDDRERWAAAERAVTAGDLRRMETEVRLVRRDGSTLWCSQVGGVVRDAEGRPESFVAITEDITERRRQAERAGHIQRQLLPQVVPSIAGYDLAGICLPAQEVAGDFYDWVMTADGSLDLTVADVMGKGVGAALVMAVLRTALRSAPASIGPADRVRVAADSLARGLSDEGLFVTLFHGRLDIASGVLRYVDAGHGHCGVRAPDGRLRPLPQRSLPVGVRDDEVFDEGIVRLDPGDSLVLYSDGLVEREDRVLAVGDLEAALGGATDAAEMVGRLMGQMPERPPDDVTVVVVRRLTPDRAERGGVRVLVSAGASPLPGRSA